MTIEELEAKRDALLKARETVEGEAVAQINAQIAAVEWEIGQLAPPDKQEMPGVEQPEEPPEVTH